MSSVTLQNIDSAVAIVLDQVAAAYNQTTFAVGGIMVDNASGELIQAMHNNVIIPLANNVSFTHDPTAHGERQLVYWYYANKDRLNLPEPSALTIITSLDPCAMCAGTLLTAGFNVGVAAYDTYAGINCAQNFQFTTLPPNLRPQAKETFGYYASGPASEPPTYTRQYVGGPHVAFKNTTLSPANLMNCGGLFNQSVNAVRTTSSNSGLPPAQLQNPATSPAAAPIVQAYQAVCDKAFTIQIENPRLPDQRILDELEAAMQASPGARNAVAFIDPFGNLVLCLADTFDVSPVHAAFMNVTQAYAITRWNLMDQYAQGSLGVDPANYLTHPKYGTFVFLYAPEPDESITVMTLGAYGSTMEGSIPQMFPANLQFFKSPRSGANFSQLVPVVTELPPFYNESVNLSLMQAPAYVCNCR